jgi:endonuclease V-like protein UPF0215 family
MVIDGFIFGSATLEGDDSTDAILKMFRNLKRNDINIIMISGAIISLYNIIDIDKIGRDTDTPVICITFNKSKGITSAIKHHFPSNWGDKVRAYSNLGKRERIELSTGYKVFIRTHGIDTLNAKKVLNKFTIQGAIPEPIRLARLIAKAKLDS